MLEEISLYQRVNEKHGRIRKTMGQGKDMNKFQELTYKERVKHYLVVTVILAITMLLMPYEYPTWTPVLTIAIMAGTIIYNLFKWNIQTISTGKAILIYNTFLLIILCYFVFFIPYNISFMYSVTYFILTITASIIDYFRKRGLETEKGELR